jgi:hypothetical protein
MKQASNHMGAPIDDLLDIAPTRLGWPSTAENMAKIDKGVLA